MSTFTKVKTPIIHSHISLKLIFLDEKKLQQSSNSVADESEADLPHIDLNEMLADMTMEDTDKMDS